MMESTSWTSALDTSSGASFSRHEYLTARPSNKRPHPTTAAPTVAARFGMTQTKILCCAAWSIVDETAVTQHHMWTLPSPARAQARLPSPWTGRGIWKWTRRRNQKIHRLVELETSRGVKKYEMTDL